MHCSQQKRRVLLKTFHRKNLGYNEAEEDFYGAYRLVVVKGDKMDWMEFPPGLVIIRDVNRICQSVSVYALIQGETHPRKINRARKRQGVLEVRTAAQDVWMSQVISLEWVNKELGFPVRCMAQDIR